MDKGGKKRSIWKNMNEKMKIKQTREIALISQNLLYRLFAHHGQLKCRQ
jgi:hypothetical protein